MLAALAGCLLAGCAPTDPYFIDPDYGSRGGVGGNTGDGGRGNSKGMGGSSFSGGASSGGQSASGGDSSCMPGCTGICCDGKCVDARMDKNHCGSCETVCNAGRECKQGVCSSGWVPSAKAPISFAPRERAAFAPMGDKIFIWGGMTTLGFTSNALNDGAIYDPVSDKWSQISTDAGTPSPRQLATAVWTGKAVLVYGGRNAAGTTYYKDAALYDPVADSWSPAGNAATMRASATGFATATSVIFYGGLTTGSVGIQGVQRYDIATNTWATTAVTSAPDAAIGVAMGSTATSLFTFGGLRNKDNQRTDATYRYDAQADTWTQLDDGPAQQAFTFGASDGSDFYVWGGRDNLNNRSEGAVFSNDAWRDFTDESNAPSARAVSPRLSGWSFAFGPGVVAFLGGLNANGVVVKNGGMYDAQDGWTSIPQWPSNEDHQWAVAARAGGELFLWGGTNGMLQTGTGERWAP